MHHDRAFRRQLRHEATDFVFLIERRAIAHESPSLSIAWQRGRRAMTKKITQRVMHAIDDLTCEVFLRLAQELGEPAIEDPQGSLCATLLEIEKECRVFAQDLATPAPPRRRPKGRQVEKALQSLTPDQRDALFLHLGKGMTCLEISRQTGIPREAVLNDLVRAYSRLRLLLGDDNLREIC